MSIWKWNVRWTLSDRKGENSWHVNSNSIPLRTGMRVEFSFCDLHRTWNLSSSWIISQIKHDSSLRNAFLTSFSLISIWSHRFFARYSLLKLGQISGVYTSFFAKLPSNSERWDNNRNKCRTEFRQHWHTWDVPPVFPSNGLEMISSYDSMLKEVG
jgi:hypothetical protein